jgi:hypothetical protein
MNTCKIGFENSGSNMVGTSRSELNTSIGHYLRETKYTLREVNHNHSNGNLISSWNKSQSISNCREGDVPYTATIENIFSMLSLILIQLNKDLALMIHI